MIASKFDARIIEIPPESFNHGLTRSTAIQLANAELLYFTVQDAWLSKPDMLEQMLRHFEEDSVAAVVGEQGIPWGEKDKNPAYWFKRQSEPEIELRYFPQPEVFMGLTKLEQFKLSSWDNVNAMYR
ncbi:MAG: hypothetical protein EOO43_11900, partial [Flavobacterium sp.]